MQQIHFDDVTHIMELSLAGLRLHSIMEIGKLYDSIEDAIAGSGRTHWYFLVETGDLHVNPAVWSYWASRGRMLNLGHSLGTVRYGASAENRSRLESAGRVEGFDPNICATREDALARISVLKAQTPERPAPHRTLSFHELFDRLSFDHSLGILDMDMTRLQLHTIVDVDDVYDHIETRILCMAPQLRWYFLVNYEGAQIAPTVASHYAIRGQKLNQKYSAGTARYGVSMSQRDQMHLRAESRRFQPNIFETRAEALDHLRRMMQTPA